MLLYIPAGLLDGRRVLHGSDFAILHQQRMELARRAILDGHGIPGWNPFELLGTPFAANIQSFPWIPSRLVLLLFEPSHAYAPGVVLAASLAALFTFLFARRIGLPPPDAAIAAWTFAAAGFFSSRAAAGHLPLLEAYPALPLLLWLVERTCDGPHIRAGRALALAAATGAVSLAGHPQLPTYAIGATLLYVGFRCGVGIRGRAVLVSIVLGAASSLVVWWPMIELARRSTRSLPLGSADNDLAMPWSRLAAAVVPDIDGIPLPYGGNGIAVFHGYPSTAYFWDTVVYVGTTPLIAVLGLFLVSVYRRKFPQGPWLFLAVLGLVALLFSLPWLDPLRRVLPGTMLRSPARLCYITTFTLALAAGRASSLLRTSSLFRAQKSWLPRIVFFFILLIHGSELGSFSRMFLLLRASDSDAPAELRRLIVDAERSGMRVGVDREFSPLLGDSSRDVGTFESILLAGPYRALLSMSGAPPDLNTQLLSAGHHFGLRALQAACVRTVLTSADRSDLDRIASADGLTAYRVPAPEPCARFVATSQTRILPASEIPAALSASPPPALLLENGTLPSEPHSSPDESRGKDFSLENPKVSLVRPSTDRIQVTVSCGSRGYLKVIEAFEPGWSASVDGVPTTILLADSYAMAIPLEAGQHQIEMNYTTPGRLKGAVGSAFALLVLLLFSFRLRRSGGDER